MALAPDQHKPSVLIFHSRVTIHGKPAAEDSTPLQCHHSCRPTDPSQMCCLSAGDPSSHPTKGVAQLVCLSAKFIFPSCKTHGLASWQPVRESPGEAGTLRQSAFQLMESLLAGDSNYVFEIP